MNCIRLASLSALSLFLATQASPLHAQALVDYANTADERAVGAIFDTNGLAATPGSSLDQDYDRLLTGTNASINGSVHSMLPTTAYAMPGIANSLASAEERGVMGRLRSLRHGDELRQTQRVAATSHAPVILPLQDSDEALLDLRDGKKAPSLTGAQTTTNTYRAVSPALYKDMPTKTPPETSTWVERQYDETMRLTTIGAGAPNEYYRNTTGARNLRIVPNMADRATTKVLNGTAELAGASQIAATATSGMPRRTMVMMRESDRAAASSYRGQPMSLASTRNQEILVPTSPPTATHYPAPVITGGPTPLTPEASAAPTTFGGSLNEPVAPPVITGPNDAAASAMTSDAPNFLGQPAAPSRPPFAYRRIDQSQTLTTPQLEIPSKTRSALTIPQDNAYAMATALSESNIKRIEPRKSTEAGSLLWVDKTPKTTPAPVASGETAAPASPQTPYGTRAVPVSSVPVSADRRWGLFISGDTGFGSAELQADSNKTKTTTVGFTAGADYRLQDKSYLGLALTYAHNSFTTSTMGDVRANSASVSLYGTTTYMTDAYVDGYMSIGYHSLDSERTVFAGANTIRTANASPDGYQLGGKIETGYDVKGSDWRYGPFAGFRLAYADFGSFTEKDAGNFNLHVRGLNALSAIASLGLGGSHRFAMANGGALLPAMRVGYNHEFGDDRSDIKAEFVNLANSNFTTKSGKKSRDWVNVSPSLSVVLPNDWSFVAQYEHDFFRDDVNENIFNLVAQYKW